MQIPNSPPDLPPSGALLFVYGTLQRGGKYHYILKESSAGFMGRGKTRKAYPLVVAAYPCLLDEPGKGFRVEGEVYRMESREDWIPVDRLEGHPVEYRRRPEEIEMEGKVLPAWTYFYIRKDLDPRRFTPIRRFPVSPG